VDHRAGPLAAKICGLRTPESALHAARIGADFTGVILVAGTPRGVDVPTAQRITQAIKAYREQDPAPALAHFPPTSTAASSASSATNAARLWQCKSVLQNALRRAKPLTVGVYMNAPASEVYASATEAGFDVIQLHGDEDPEDFASFACGIPLCKVVHVPVPLPEAEHAARAIADAVAGRIARWSHVAHAILIDSKAAAAAAASGGTGAVFDHDKFFSLLDAALEQQANVLQSEPAKSVNPPLPAPPVPLILAGGLTPSSVGGVIQALGKGKTKDAVTPAAAGVVGGALASRVCIWGLDVSSGVEYAPGETILDGVGVGGGEAAATPNSKPVGKGVKDPVKVQEFVRAVKAVVSR
jgi:anthranilate synthase/indole-3-glycerol phosphate synthase/phosphoribosylanthranilate isomerase